MLSTPGLKMIGKTFSVVFQTPRTMTTQCIYGRKEGREVGRKKLEARRPFLAF
jgi:hypothetical protein